MDDAVNITETNKEELKGEAFLIVGRIKGTEMIKFVGISETEDMKRLYLNDFTTMNLRETDPSDPAIQNADITIFRYCGDNEPMKEFFTLVIRLALSNQKDNIWNIIEMMSKFGIFYTDKKGLKNNKNKKMDFIKKKGGEES